MPKSISAYADPALALEYRNRQRYNNYYGHLPIDRKVTRRKWTEEEDEMVRKHEIKDRKLAKKLNRTISAIQQRRNELKKLETTE